MSSPIVGRMTEDKDGNLWICTEGGGVNVYDRINNTYRWYRHEEGRNSISHNNVKAIYYDRANEIMWIGTHLGGLNKLDLRTNRFTVYRMKAGDPDFTAIGYCTRYRTLQRQAGQSPHKTESAFSARPQVVADNFLKRPKKEEISAWWPAFASIKWYFMGCRHRRGVFTLIGSTLAS